LSNLWKLENWWIWRSLTIQGNWIGYELGEIGQFWEIWYLLKMAKFYNLSKRTKGWIQGSWKFWVRRPVDELGELDNESCATNEPWGSGTMGEFGKVYRECIVLKTLKWFFVILPFI
jgi:hypothetical protein